MTATFKDLYSSYILSCSISNTVAGLFLLPNSVCSTNSMRLVSLDTLSSISMLYSASLTLNSRTGVTRALTILCARVSKLSHSSSSAICLRLLSYSLYSVSCNAITFCLCSSYLRNFCCRSRNSYSRSYSICRCNSICLSLYCSDSGSSIVDMRCNLCSIK